MISLTHFKAKLGPHAEGLTDHEIEQIRDQMYQLADMAFNVWAKENRLKNKIDSSV